jgi:2-polyprenyl-6-hydroxyphenyl methylase/3-demethylubiquinone-9 3-methyltransferase
MTNRTPAAAGGTTVDRSQVEQFARLAEEWWDEAGPFQPLHRLNPTRLAFIRRVFLAHFGRDERSFAPFSGLRLLDLGCGGGLVSEPMARLGFEVVGADAGEANVRVARHHAAGVGLRIDYVHATAEELASWGESFDAILNMEVIEHVADVPAFIGACARLLRPGGAMVVATLNRTLRSYALGVVAAEYVLRWVPAGTHDWNRFVRPSELARLLRDAGLELSELSGMSYDPLARDWRLSGDLAVNYIGLAVAKRH